MDVSSAIAFFESLRSDDGGPELFYGIEEEDEEDEETNEADKLEKPTDDLIATSEILKDKLHVKGHSFNVKANTLLHRTKDYACTTRSDDNEKKKNKLVVRRGGDFTLTLDFSRPFNLADDDIKLEFKTGGPNAKQSSFANGQFRVDETGEKEREANKWSGKLMKKDGNTVTIDVHIAANCAIGNWTFTVTTFLMKDEGELRATYDPREKFAVIFNPWCKDDTTFMPDLLTEKNNFDDYVLGDDGIVYQGNGYAIHELIWHFGQFDKGMLEAAIYLLNCLEEKVAKRSSPVDVARKMTRMVNVQNDGGVLVGNWSGDFTGGVKPWNWKSSVDILEKYMKTKKPVKFGQCWVYSAVLTTLCRALGLPARSITNFASAHDTDGSCTIDTYFDADGGPLNSRDSIWNFHVWNEAWLQRPDIPIPRNHNKGCFDGWQVIDATPQETSNHIYTCGPSPLYAIKRGMVTIPYDTTFVFAEVNGDEVYWTKQPNGEFGITDIKADAVGKFISTKTPDEPEKMLYFWNTPPRLDLTKDYKFPDGSVEDRAAKTNAALGSPNFIRDYLIYRQMSKNVSIKMTHGDKHNYGEDLVVCLNAKHEDISKKDSLDLTGVAFRFQPQNYRGKFTGPPFCVVPQTNTTLKKAEKCSFETTLKFKDYKNKLGEGLCMSIQAIGSVMEGSRKIQFIAERHDLTWRVPDLEVKLPESVNVGDMFEAVVEFKSSLPEKLSNCKLYFTENKYIAGNESIELDDIPANGGFRVKFPLKAMKAKRKAYVRFALNCSELTEQTGGIHPDGDSRMNIKKLN